MQERPIVWLGSTLEDVREFPEDARGRVGHELRRVQSGLPPSDWRPMPTVGTGVVEIRVHTRQEFRVFYVVRRPSGIFVVHAFQKRSRMTPRAAIELARDRLRGVPPR